MITTDQLEQLAIPWLHDTGWNYVNGTVVLPTTHKDSLSGEIKSKGG
jgi:hypothetical protein